MGTGHSWLNELLVESCLGHSPKWCVSQDMGSICGRHHQQDMASVNLVGIVSGIVVGPLVQHKQSGHKCSRGLREPKATHVSSTGESGGPKGNRNGTSTVVAHDGHNMVLMN